MICGQPSFLKVMISTIDNDMAIRTADSERVHGDPTNSVRGPGRWFERELQSPFRCWNLWVDFLEVDIWRDEPVLKDKNRLDDADRC